MSNITDIIVDKNDLGKNLYKKVEYYTLKLEHHVLADNKDEAETMFSEIGIDHDKIDTGLASFHKKVETVYADANYNDSDTAEYLGKVTYNEYNDDAVEDEDVEINTLALETDKYNMNESENAI